MGMCRTCSPQVTLACAKLQKPNPTTPTPHKSKAKTTRQHLLQAFAKYVFCSCTVGTVEIAPVKYQRHMPCCQRAAGPNGVERKPLGPNLEYTQTSVQTRVRLLPMFSGQSNKVVFDPVRGFSQSSPNLSNPNKTYRPSFCPYSPKGSLKEPNQTLLWNLPNHRPEGAKTCRYLPLYQTCQKLPYKGNLD